MSQIKEARDYIWALPLIGGILILISVFTPAYYATIYPVEEYYWMWGLSYVSVAGYGSETMFLPAEQPRQYLMPVFLSGLIPFILILFSSIALSISANAVRTGKTDLKQRENLWMAMGITLFVAPIIFAIGIDITTRNYIEFMIGSLPPGYNFWDVYNPGFAVIAPIIGAILSIVGSIASKKMRTRELYDSKPNYITQKQGGMITKTPIGQVSRNIKFCSECGHQLLYDGARFCPNCGEAIKY